MIWHKARRPKRRQNPQTQGRPTHWLSPYANERREATWRIVGEGWSPDPLWARGGHPTHHGRQVVARLDWRAVGGRPTCYGRQMGARLVRRTVARIMLWASGGRPSCYGRQVVARLSLWASGGRPASCGRTVVARFVAGDRWLLVFS